MNTDADENYWIGVRDALRMVDSFIEWAKRNPDRAKPIDQFVNEALIAAAKRCKSCLSHALGVSFAASNDEERKRIAERPSVDFFEDARTMVEGSPLAHTLSDPDDLYHETLREPGPPPVPDFPEVPTDTDDVADDYTLFETSPEPADAPDQSPLTEGPSTTYEPSQTAFDTDTDVVFHETRPSDEPPASSHLDSLERTGSMSEEDIFTDTDDTPRDFEADFHLVEPEPLTTQSRDEYTTSSVEDTEPELPTDDDSTHDASPETSTLESTEIDIDSLTDALAELGQAIDEALYGHTEDKPETKPSEGSTDTGFTWDEYDEMMSPSEEPVREITSDETVVEKMSSDSWEPDSDELLTSSTLDDEPVSHGIPEPLVTPPPVVEPPEEPLVTPPPTVSEISEERTVTYSDERSIPKPAVEHSTESETESRDTWSPAPERNDAWSPYDEPSDTDEETSSDTIEPDEAAPRESRSTSPIISPPPPPPPPPETDETEEERQKRTRRLFFGA